MQALRTKAVFLERFMSSKPDVTSCVLHVMEFRKEEIKVSSKYF